MYAAAILCNFYEACRAVRILIGDVDKEEYFGSILTRREIEKQLATIVASAKALPDSMKAQLPKIPWADWAGLEPDLSCSTLAKQDAVWEALSDWLPTTGHYLNQYRWKSPGLFRIAPTG